MKKNLLLTLFFSGILCHAISQNIKLTAIFDFNNSAVKLNWNMINSESRTSYILLRSDDGITWKEAVKDRMLRYYNGDDIYFFNDRNFLPGKNFYRIKIIDGYNNTIALSPVMAVTTRGIGKTIATPQLNIQKESTVKPLGLSPKITSQPQTNNNSWIIYPNPATDVLTLSYKGSGDLKGVVNVQIQNASGKVVIKFRSGSMYKTIQIPISNLVKGAYFIQVSVQNQLMMNQKFIKQ